MARAFQKRPALVDGFKDYWMKKDIDGMMETFFQENLAHGHVHGSHSEYEMFMKWIELFEGRIEEFLSTQNFSLEEWYAEMREIISAGPSLPNYIFVRKVLDALDFEQFQATVADFKAAEEMGELFWVTRGTPNNPFTQ